MLHKGYEFDRLKKYYDWLIKVEPILTKTIHQLITTSFPNQGVVKLAGLNNRVKSLESFINKSNRIDRVYPKLFYLYDVIRYTVILPNDSFYSYFKQITLILIKNNFNLYRIKNTWQKFDKGIPYRGVNTIFSTDDGIVFEIQFHTHESYNTNEETHQLYEKLLYNTLSEVEIQNIKCEMLNYVYSLIVPSDVSKIIDFDNSQVLLNILLMRVKTL